LNLCGNIILNSLLRGARGADTECVFHSYYVCEKSDGIRYLLYFTADEAGNELHYLIDRKNDYWFIHHRNLHFPIKGDDQRFHTRTLADGELVMDDGPDGTKVPRFLVFDCLVLDGKDLMARTLDKRLAYFQENVMNPYRDLFRRYPEELPYQAFQMAMKDMQLGYGIEKMFREVLPSLKHGNDGLIFTCRNTAYQFGTDPHILKWKPVHENTIDFRLRLAFPAAEPDDADRADGVVEPYVDYDALPRAELLVYWGDTAGGEPYQPFAELHLTEDEWEALKALGDPLQNRIVECAMDESGRWRLYRFRDDKAEANHISTVRSVMDSIRDSVSEQELLDAAPAIKEAWKLRQAREVQAQKR
jgi:mRNA guanylyltransferase